MDMRDEAIHEAVSPQDVARVRELFCEYADWLQVDLCFQGFERELAIPGYYVNPLPGVVYLALDLGRVPDSRPAA